MHNEIGQSRKKVDKKPYANWIFLESGLETLDSNRTHDALWVRGLLHSHGYPSHWSVTYWVSFFHCITAMGKMTQLGNLCSTLSYVKELHENWDWTKIKVRVVEGNVQCNWTWRLIAGIISGCSSAIQCTALRRNQEVKCAFQHCSLKIIDSQPYPSIRNYHFNVYLDCKSKFESLIRIDWWAS